MARITNTLSVLKQRYNEAQALYDAHKFDESAKLIESIYPLAIQENDKKFKGEVLALAGHNNFSLGNYDRCLKQFTEAGYIFKELRLFYELSSAESSLGATYTRLGLYAHSLFKNLEGLTYSFQINEDYGLACCMVNAANSLDDIGHPERAFRALDTAILLCERHKGDKKFELVHLLSYNNKANIHGRLGRTEEMLRLLLFAREIAVKYAFKIRLNLIDSNIARCLMDLKRYDEAYQLLTTALKKRKNLPDDQYMSNLMKMAGIYKEHFNDSAGFLKYMDKALSLAVRMKIVYRQVIINKQLKNHYALVNDSRKVEQINQRLRVLEEQDGRNKQTGGMENFFDAILLTAESKLHEHEQKPEFLNRCDYLIGAYSYSYHGIVRHIPFHEIAFCEIRDNDLHIYSFIKNSMGKMVLQQTHKMRKTMKDFISELGASGAFFARTHNSFIVNLYLLSKDSPMSGSSLKIGDHELKISDTYRSAFRKKLNAFLKQQSNLI